MRRGFSFFLIFLFLFSSPSFPKKGGKKRKKPRTFQVDFREKDIHDFLKAMSAITGKNIIADDRVRGKITVISPKPIPVKQALPYLISVLAVKGYGVVEHKGLLRVVPLKEAIAASPYIRLGKTPLPFEKIEKEEPITHIVPIENTKPSRIAGILRKITSPKVQVVEYDDVGMLIITGNALEVNRLVKIAASLDLAPPEEVREEFSFGNIHIYRLENIQAEKVAQTLNKLTWPVGAGKNQKQKKLQIVAFKETNSLIYIGTKEEFQALKGLISKLDLPRDQVLLEVLIVEVGQSKANSFGINWRIDSKGTHTQFNTGLAAQGGLIDPQTGDPTGVNTLIGFSIGVLKEGKEKIMSIINANLNRDNFRILSAPQILTLDNQEAEISVGEEVPVRTLQRTAGAADQTVIVDQFEYKSIGLVLKFTPYISKNEVITIDLYQEIKAIAGDPQNITTNPRFTRRSIKTTIRVNNGQTIVIGGLVSKNRVRGISKVPILGDLPLIGSLFRSTSYTLQRTNLLVFLTPHILTHKKYADKITSDLLEDQVLEMQKEE